MSSLSAAAPRAALPPLQTVGRGLDRRAGAFRQSPMEHLQLCRRIVQEVAEQLGGEGGIATGGLQQA